MNNKQIAIFQTLGAFTLWSTLGVFFNWTTLPVSVYVVFGSIVALCTLYIYFYFTKHSLPKFRLSWPLIGLFTMAAIKGVIWFEALRVYPIAKDMLIHNLAPVVAVLFSALILKEKPRLNHVIAILTGFIGLAILLDIRDNASLFHIGVLLSFGAAIASGFQDICQRKLAKTATGSQQAFVFILGQAVGSVLFLLPQATRPIAWTDVSSILYFGIAGTTIPIILLSSAFRGLKAFEVATLGYIEPLLGAIFAALFLRQPIVPTTALGGALIFLSGITTIKEEEKRA